MDANQANPFKRFTSEIFPYAKAVALMTDLRKQGIECGEDVGGVWILCTEDKVELMQQIVARHHTHPAHEGDVTDLKLRTLDVARRIAGERRGALRRMPDDDYPDYGRNPGRDV